MRLVAFKTAYGDVRYVNPAFVRYVYPISSPAGELSMITGDNFSFEVQEPADLVCSRLAQEDDETETCVDRLIEKLDDIRTAIRGGVGPWGPR